MITTMFAATVVEGALSSVQFLVFVGLAVGGLILLGAAAIFGGHHDGADDVGHDHDSDSDHGTGPSFLSPRVFLAFLTGFGVAGAIATAYGAGPGIATGIGFIPGLIMALIAWAVAYYLFKQQANSNIRPGQVIGASGTVVTAIRPGELGEVNVSVNGQIVPYTALSEDGQSLIRVGTRIRVVGDLGDKVIVSTQITAG